MYEGGHRVPMFIRWPDGQLTGGKDIDELVAHYDLLPTFVDMFGLDFNPVKPLDGKSFKGLLDDSNADWSNRILYMDTQRKQNLIKYKNYTVMDDNWRLVNGSELYNIDQDLAQTTNVMKTFLRLLRAYRKDMKNGGIYYVKKGQMNVMLISK